MKNKLVEYHFVDTRRIDELFEQFSSPTKLEKRRVWKFSVGWPSISLGSDGTAHARTHTRQEKIDALLSFLKQNSLINDRRFNKGFFRDDTELMFFEETVLATRCQVTGTIADQKKQIAVWIAPPETRNGPTGHLFLIEDDRRTLDSFQQVSSFSSLAALSYELEKTSADKEPPIFGVTRAFDSLARSRDAFTKFAEDPVRVLKDLGAIAAPPRKVRVLYRLRFTCMERPTDGSEYRSVIFGYPLFVSTS